MSQGSFNVPTGGNESAITFAGQCNTAWDALASKNSGASTPANGPSSAALQFQDWMDNTSATLCNWKIYDGTNWPRVGTVDTTNSLFLPMQGGGLGTIASAASTDVFGQKQTTLTMSGVATITSFGSSGQTGEWKKIIASGAFTITNNANIICPGGANITAVSGDTFDLLYEGSGLTRVMNYQRTVASTGTFIPTGGFFWMYQTGTQSGCVRANGRTIGSGASAATELANDSTANLFAQLWNASNGVSDSEMSISGGRGATAAADFAANKTITTPDLRGRSPYGLDDMGNSAASRVTGTTATPNGTTLGATFGAQTVVLVQGNLPNVTLTTSIGSGQGSHTHALTNGASVISSGAGGSISVAGASDVGTTIANATLPAMSGTTPTGGTDTAVNKMPPGKMGTWYIAL